MGASTSRRLGSFLSTLDASVRMKMACRVPSSGERRSGGSVTRHPRKVHPSSSPPPRPPSSTRPDEEATRTWSSVSRPSR